MHPGMMTTLLDCSPNVIHLSFQIFSDDDYYFMEVLDATESDRGQYTCVISNCVASESVSAALDVYIKQSKKRCIQYRIIKCKLYGVFDYIYIVSV